MTNDPEPADPIAITDDPAPEPAAVVPSAATDLDAVRDIILRAHPDVVPELVTGDSVDALIGSIEPARAAWQRLAERIGAPPVPAGGAKPLAVDPERLSASEKIRRGLARGDR